MSLVAKMMIGVSLAACVSSSTPLIRSFAGRKLAYVRRTFSGNDWHPSQAAYGDGSSFSPGSQTRYVSSSGGGEEGPNAIICPADFGADPSGAKDSSAGFAAAAGRHEAPVSLRGCWVGALWGAL